MRLPFPPVFARILRNGWFRLFVAVVLTLGHVATTMSFAHERYGWSSFNTAPGHEPVFHDVAHDAYPAYGKRLIVSRWDSEHYIGLAMRGYSQCPHRKLVADDLRGPICEAAFYPGYPAMGWLVHRLTKIPIDYAMFGISLVAAVVALFFWTDKTIVDGIGLGGAYASLLAFNFFPPACYLVFIMTDGLTAAGMIAGFVALARRRYVLAAIAIGFTGAIRISGVGGEAAYALAVVAWCVESRPRRVIAWIGRAALVALGGWGSIVVSAVHWIRAGDPLLYIHGHTASFHHEGSPLALLHIPTAVLIHGIDEPQHDLVWAFALLFFILVGHRVALRAFPVPAQVYGYALTVFVYIISLAGSVDLYYMAGLSRYVWVVVPGFLAIGALLKRHPVALFAWLVACAFHSREVDLCFFLGDVGQTPLRKCNMTQWLPP